MVQRVAASADALLAGPRLGLPKAKPAYAGWGKPAEGN